MNNHEEVSIDEIFKRLNEDYVRRYKTVVEFKGHSDVEIKIDILLKTLGK